MILSAGTKRPASEERLRDTVETKKPRLSQEPLGSLTALGEALLIDRVLPHVLCDRGSIGRFAQVCKAATNLSHETARGILAANLAHLANNGRGATALSNQMRRFTSRPYTVPQQHEAERYLKKCEFQAEYRHLEHLEQNGQEDEVIELLRDLSDQAPDSIQICYRWAATLDAMGEGDDAVKDFVRVKDSPRSSPAMRNHALAFLKVYDAQLHISDEEYQEAVDAARSAIAYKDDYAAAHKCLGLALTLVKNPAAAAASYRRAILLGDNSAAVHEWLAEALESQGEWSQAEVCYRQILTLETFRQGDTYVKLGKALEKQNKIGAAEASYQHAAMLDYHLPKPHFALGRMLILQRKLNAAEVICQRVIVLRDDWAEAHFLLAGVFAMQGNQTAFEASMRRAVTLKPALRSTALGLYPGVALQTET